MTDPVFVNFSNHPSSRWSKEQMAAAEKYGRVIDEPFPAVPADMDEAGVARVADEIGGTRKVTVFRFMRFRAY